MTPPGHLARARFSGSGPAGHPPGVEGFVPIEVEVAPIEGTAPLREVFQLFSDHDYLVYPVVSPDGEIAGRGWTAPGGRPHAEAIALERAGAKAEGSTLYVTLEPCAMCMGAIVQARLARVVFGAYDARAGAAGSCIDLSGSPAFNHRFEILGGVLAEDCSALLQNFFDARR